MFAERFQKGLIFVLTHVSEISLLFVLAPEAHTDLYLIGINLRLNARNMIQERAPVRPNGTSLGHHAAAEPTEQTNRPRKDLSYSVRGSSSCHRQLFPLILIVGRGRSIDCVRKEMDGQVR